jgi:alpha-1,3-rhamnosyltransferase
MIEKILVSALIPVFNHERYVKDAILSLVSQTHRNTELILLNDGSTDGSHKKILELEATCRSRFVQYTYVSKPNQGVAATMNYGIRLATGEYTFFISSDDMVEPHAIATLLTCLESSGKTYALACGDADYIDAEGRRLYLDYTGRPGQIKGHGLYSSFLAFRTRARKDFDYRSPDFGSYTSFLGGNYIPVGLLLRRKALLEAGLYDESLQIEDLDMWLKISKTYRMRYVDETLSHYRLHATNTILTRRALLTKSILKLMLREKNYSYSSGHKKKWMQAYVKNLILNFKHLSFGDFRFFADQIPRSALIRYTVLTAATKAVAMPKLLKALLC